MSGTPTGERITQQQSSGFALPFLQGLRPFDKAHLGPDIVAGITLAALGIPEVMGYTKIIGTPVITGLYTLFLPVVVFAVFGSSRHLVVSADSATAAMVAAALTSLSFTPNTPRYIELTSLIGIVVAAILILARILQLGFLADFLSRSVLVGFLSGVGVQVAVGQLHDMLGIEKGGHGFFRQLLYTFEHLRDTHLPSLFIALAVLAIIVLFEVVAPRFPGALLAVIGMTAASAYFHWADRGIQVVGTVPGGLPHLGLPRLAYNDIVMVLPISLSCFIVILAQSAATSRAYALKYRDQFNQNVDLIGLSLSNVAAGCSSTFVVNGSPTKTAMVEPRAAAVSGRTSPLPLWSSRFSSFSLGRSAFSPTSSSPPSSSISASNLSTIAACEKSSAPNLTNSPWPSSPPLPSSSLASRKASSLPSFSRSSSMYAAVTAPRPASWFAMPPPISGASKIPCPSSWPNPEWSSSGSAPISSTPTSPSLRSRRACLCTNHPRPCVGSPLMPPLSPDELSPVRAVWP